MIGFVRNSKAANLHRDAWMRPGRIGDENDGQPLGARLGKRFTGGCKGLNAIVKHAPDIAKDHVVTAGDFPKTVDPDGHAGFLQTRLSG